MNCLSPDVVLSLLVWAANHTGLPVPEIVPTVQCVSVEWMRERKCGPTMQCRPPFGLYEKRNVVYILDRLTWQAREHVALHELVHFLQHHAGKLDLESCEGVQDNERQAFHAQNVYIAEVQGGIGWGIPPFQSCPAEQH